MRVDIDDNLDGCPDECPYADIRTEGEVMSGVDGAAAVFVTISCGHQSVCRHRARSFDRGESE